MKRTISSSQTFIMKVLFPLVWITGFGIGTLTMFINPSNDTDAMKWQFLFGWIIGSAVIFLLGVRLKKVSIDGSSLYISNYLKEISVPLADIERVTENVWINIHPVTIHLKSSSEFGGSILFMPKARFGGWFSSHPVVAELRELAKSQIKYREANLVR